ncbi:MAG: hypothetical protein ABIJ35_02345 [Acidobacteriota bacterium]
MGKLDGDQLGSNNTLESWKEIALYLDKNIRTCQRWEKELGLPVHRLDGIDKSRVFAFKKEIDGWQSKQLYLRGPESPAPKNAWRIPLVAVLIILTFVSGIISKLNKPTNEIIDLWIDGGKITFVNDRYQPVGEFETGIPRLIDENYYKSRMHSRNPDMTDGPLPIIHLSKTNNAGPQDVLLVVGPLYDRSRRLSLLDGGSSERWRVDFGEDVGRPFGIDPDRLWITGFCCDDVNGDGRMEIIVLLNDREQSLCQVSVLDYATGDSLAAFVHPGAINDCLTWDLDGDGQKEVLLAGLNVNTNQAFAAIMDFNGLDADGPDPSADEPDPSADQNSEIFQSRFLETYALFPQNRFTDYIKQYNKILEIEVKDEGNPQIVFRGNSILHCTSHLTLQSIQYDLRTRMEHPKLVRQGLVGDNLREIIDAELAEGVLYFEGGEWVRRPA